MKLEDLLSVQNIATKIDVKDKEQVIKKLIDLMGNLHDYGGRDNVFKVVLEREKLMSTGVGHGIAIPHGKVEQCPKIIASLCTLNNGVDFSSPDQKPINLAILLVGPKSETSAHIRALAHISKLVQDEKTRRDLLEAVTPSMVFDILKKREEKFFA